VVAVAGAQGGLVEPDRHGVVGGVTSGGDQLTLGHADDREVHRDGAEHHHDEHGGGHQHEDAAVLASPVGWLHARRASPTEASGTGQHVAAPGRPLR
jgi:hypothetical protein